MLSKSHFVLVSSLFFSIACAQADNSQQVDINHANENQLMQLKGVGQKRAQAIVTYRKAHGPFKNVNELTQVRGINKKFVDEHSKQLSLTAEAKA